MGNKLNSNMISRNKMQQVEIENSEFIMLNNNYMRRVTDFSADDKRLCITYGHIVLAFCNNNVEELLCVRCGYKTYYCKKCKKDIDVTKCQHYA